MKNILMLSWANIRKSKSQAISLLLFVLFAVMFLNTGLVMFLQIGGFFDERAERNHAAHFTGIYHDGADAIEQGSAFMKNYPGVAEIEAIDSLSGTGNCYINGKANISTIVLSRADGPQRMDAPVLVGESLPLSSDAIYVPYFMMSAGDYRIGDDFKLEISGTMLDFTVAGATEEIMFGAQMLTVYRFYISDERFYELQEQLPEWDATLLSARLENRDGAVFFKSDYDKEISKNGMIYEYIYDDAKQSRTIVPSVVGLVVTAFSIILLGVSMIVIHFRIINSIEESMTNIGAQKAVGYRNYQIVSSVVMQFGVIAVIGGVSGIALSQPVISAITGILEPMIALVWKPGFDVFIAMVSLALALLAVILISFISTRRINRLHPLIALRGGITTHSFIRNPLPLDKAVGSLSFLLALKQLLHNKKRAATISIIIAAVTMASIAGLAINYNMNEGRDNFVRSFFGEIPETNFVLNSGSDGEAFKARMLKRPEVRKVFGYVVAGVTILVDETKIELIVAEDCSLFEGEMLVEGRYPQYDNEIALGPSILKVTGKGTGDIVMVRDGDNAKEYLVTGIVQYMNGNGFNGLITSNGFLEIQPDYQLADFNVYLNDGVDVKAFIEEVKKVESDTVSNILNIDDQLSVVLDSMGGIFGAVAIGIVAITVFVVILTLYMVIKATILRRRRELGIQKALGFTTLQLMNQIALNMAPVILLGVVLGAVAGYFWFNPMMRVLMSGMGFVKVNLPVPLYTAVVVCAALVMFAYLVSMLIAWRIRKISAYALVSE